MLKRRANATQRFAVSLPSQPPRLGYSKPVVEIPLQPNGRKVACRRHMTTTMLMHRNRPNDGRTVAGRQVRRFTARGAQGMELCVIGFDPAAVGTAPSGLELQGTASPYQPRANHLQTNKL